MSAKDLYHQTEEKPITRLLRRTGSEEYFRDGGWTAIPDEANHFCDVVEAAEVCVRYGLTDVELAIRYETEALDVFCTPIR